MLKNLEPYVMELEQEAGTTRKCFDQIPENKMGWRPHEKSFSIGELAMHIAMFPAICVEFLSVDEFASDKELDRITPRSRQEIHSTFDASLKTIKEYFSGIDEQTLMGNWKLVLNGQEIVSGPRNQILRPFLMSHMYHHRGQLSVYLRLLNVPVPPIYGPTADFNPFREKVSTI